MPCDKVREEVTIQHVAQTFKLRFETRAAGVDSEIQQNGFLKFSIRDLCSCIFCFSISDVCETDIN